MKNIKIVLSIILIITMFTFVGCSSKDKDKDNDNAKANQTDENSDNTTFNYSAGLADNGFFENVKALDYVTLPDYKGITIPTDIKEVSDEMVQEQVDGIVSNYATENKILDRVVKDGDSVNIDYVGSVNDVEFEGGSTEGNGTTVTIGETSYIDDFLEQLIGHKPGESFDIEVTFPDDYNEESLKGKDAVFATTINYISESVTPKLTDEFVAKNLATDFNWKTVDEMKESIKKEMQTSSIQKYAQDYIAKNSKVSSVPDNVLQYQKDSLIAYYENNASMEGVGLEEYLTTNMGIKTTDELIEKNTEDIKTLSENVLIMQAIAEDTDLSITEDDITSYFLEYTKSEDYSQAEEKYGLPYLKFSVLQREALNYIIDNSK